MFILTDHSFHPYEYHQARPPPYISQPPFSSSPADTPPRLTVSVPSTPSRPGGSGIGNVSSFSPSIGKCRITASSQFSNNHARQRSTSSSSPDSAPHPPEHVQNGRSNHAGQNPPNSQSTMAVILSVAGSTSTLSWARSLWQKT